jgi:Fe-S oxidoreductase
VQAAKFARDPRDRADRAALIEGSGADHCMSCYRCEQVCPIHIPIVTEAVMPMRGMAARGPTGKASHPMAFAANIRSHGFAHSPSLFLRTRGFWGALRAIPLALRMIARGKSRLMAPSWKGAREGVTALFRQAGEEIGR